MGSPSAAYSVFNSGDFAQPATCDDFGSVGNRALPTAMAFNEDTNDFSEDRWADEGGNQWIRYRRDEDA
jgi:hypothetical protein